MKKIHELLAPVIIFAGLLSVFCPGCSKKDSNNNGTPQVNVPVVVTSGISDITSNAASCGGNITADQGSVVTGRGVCWCIGSTPTIADSKTVDGTGAGAFTSRMTGLLADTTYFVRAYATNGNGTGYGNTLSFRTCGPLPALTTSSVTKTSPNSVTCGGEITTQGGSAILARGVCWSLSPNPTINDNKTSDGTGMGIFTSQVTMLSPDTTYYIRAYAANSNGTGYGNALSFRTGAAPGEHFGGGVVAYVLQPGDYCYTAGEIHGLIAATTDIAQGNPVIWGPYTNSISTSATLCSGGINTSVIVNELGEGNYAASLCYDWTCQGYDDWFLPSLKELQKLYLNRSMIDGLENATQAYWTSSLGNGYQPYAIWFADGSVQVGDASVKLKVRAVRYF